MANVAERLAEVHKVIAGAMRAVEDDPGSSTVLRAVLKEFTRTSTKARDDFNPGNPALTRERITELEQAGDSAKAAAQADPSIGALTRKAVLAAHDAARDLKHGL